MNVELIVTTGLYSIVCPCLTNRPVYPVQVLVSSVVMELAMYSNGGWAPFVLIQHIIMSTDVLR